MNNHNSFVSLSPQFRLLSESQIQEIHRAALEVLRRTGIRFHHQGAIDLLKEAGAFIHDGNLVKFTPSMVEDALASIPSRIVMCDRDGDPAMYLEGSKVHFGPGSDCLNIIDPETGERRKFTTSDIINGYRLCDALPNIDFVMSIGLPSDVDVQMTYDVQIALMLEHTTKPIVFVTDNATTCRRAIEMAAAVAGSHDALREQQHILLYSEPTSPLRQSETAVDKLLMMAEHGLPVVHSPAPQMGALAPVTMAGGLVITLAEIMSSIVVHQMTNPGSPFVFGAGVHHMDMKAAQICYGSPEFQLTKAAIAELGRWYGIPTWGYAGCTDAKVLDEQASLEALLSIVMAKLSGANLIHDVGYMESGLTGSFELIVLADELIALANHLTQGIEVNEETLMIEEINRVGPGGHFLDTDETLLRYRDFWYPSFLDRSMYKTWREQGSITLGQRLNARMKEIVKDHQSKPLAAEKKTKVQEILAQAAKAGG